MLRFQALMQQEKDITQSWVKDVVRSPNYRELGLWCIVICE
jgi:hypothetical protein